MQWLFLIILIPYIYLITKIYFRLKNIKAFQPESVPDLFVSVIVACRNEEKELPLLMSDIAEQTYNPDHFELVIVDDNSSDSTFEIASAFDRIKKLKVLKSTGKGKKQAIRKGIEASAGSFIITTDADCRAGKNWLKTITAYQDEYKPEMIICPVKQEGGRGFFHRFQELEFLSLQGITAGSAIGEDPVMCNGANLAFLKEAYFLHADNLHDELVSGDDVFLLHNIKRDTGKRILWLESSEASVITKTSDTLMAFLRQRARWVSKAGAYSDKYTKVLTIVTFVTILVQVLLLLYGCFSPELLRVFLAYFVLKSIPDILVLSETAARYGKKSLMRWFLPSQLVYPFYVLAIIPGSIANRGKWSY